MPLNAAYPTTFRFLPIIRGDPSDLLAFADDRQLEFGGSTCRDSA
jgi:hypothetical protein